MVPKKLLKFLRKRRVLRKYIIPIVMKEKIFVGKIVVKRVSKRKGKVERDGGERIINNLTM